MTGEEAGPPGPKVFRLFYFVAAGFICTTAINKWREFERKSLLQKQNQQQLSDNPTTTVQKAVK